MTLVPLTRTYLLKDLRTEINIICRYTTVDICNAIYGSIPGAFYDPNQVRWVVPCEAEVDVALQIGCVPIDTSHSSNFLKSTRQW